MVWGAWDAWDVHVLHSHSAWLTGGCSCKRQWSLPLQLSVPALKRPRGRQLWPWCRTSVWRGWESPWPLAETWWSRGRRWGCWLLEGALVFNLKEGWGRVIQKLDRKICWFQPRKPQKRTFSTVSFSFIFCHSAAALPPAKGHLQRTSFNLWTQLVRSPSHVAWVQVGASHYTLSIGWTIYALQVLQATMRRYSMIQSQNSAFSRERCAEVVR